MQATIQYVDAFNATDFRPELAALGRATAHGISGAKLVEYVGVSHGLVVTEQQRVTRELLDFLGG